MKTRTIKKISVKRPKAPVAPAPTPADPLVPARLGFTTHTLTIRCVSGNAVLDISGVEHNMPVSTGDIVTVNLNLEII